MVGGEVMDYAVGVVMGGLVALIIVEQWELLLWWIIGGVVALCGVWVMENVVRRVR